MSTLKQSMVIEVSDIWIHLDIFPQMYSYFLMFQFYSNEYIWTYFLPKIYIRLNVLFFVITNFATCLVISMTINQVWRNTLVKLIISGNQVSPKFKSCQKHPEGAGGSLNISFCTYQWIIIFINRVDTLISKISNPWSLPKTTTKSKWEGNYSSLHIN